MPSLFQPSRRTSDTIWDPTRKGLGHLRGGKAPREISNVLRATLSLNQAPGRVSTLFSSLGSNPSIIRDNVNAVWHVVYASCAKTVESQALISSTLLATICNVAQLELLYASQAQSIGDEPSSYPAYKMASLARRGQENPDTRPDREPLQIPYAFLQSS